VLEGDADASLWRQQREFSWLPERHALVKIPLSPEGVRGLEEALLQSEVQVPRRYSVGGNVAYLGWPDDVDQARLDVVLKLLDLPALALTGHWPTPLLGRQRGQAFMQRILQVLDPQGKFRLSSTGGSHAA
jgi:hypothetical protein